MNMAPHGDRCLPKKALTCLTVTPPRVTQWLTMGQWVTLPTPSPLEMFAGYTPPPDPGRDNLTPGQVRLGEARGQGDPGPADAAVKPELDPTPPCARSTLPIRILVQPLDGST